MKTLIKNGLIVDGLYSKPYQSDILIEDSYILDIGSFSEDTDMIVYDASGKYITPGFIDGHTHLDFFAIENRQQENALYQGVSSIIVGQCGLGLAPCHEEHFQEAIKMNSGIFSSDIKWNEKYTEFSGFLSLLDGAAVNVGSNISHNAIRQFVCGFDNVPLTGEKMKQAQDLLADAMEKGATGLSVGLSYYPSGYSDTEELIQLCKVVQKYDGVFCVHARLPDNKSFTPAEEIAKIVEETGVRLNYLHYKTGGFEEYSSLIEPFKKSINSGLELYLEYYPYLVGAGLVLAFLPGWVQEGGYSKIMDRLNNADLHDQILFDINERLPYFLGEGQTVFINYTSNKGKKSLNRTLHDIANARGISLEECIVQILVENDLEIGFIGVENQTEELKEKLYEDQFHLFEIPMYSVASDSIPLGQICHPRSFATFPRVIKQMRERGKSIEDIIPKITSLPAKIYRLEKRGIITKGYYADLLVLDFDNIADQSTFSNPRVRATGIETLFVNGELVMKNGDLTGVFPGQVIRKGRKAHD